LYKTNPCVTAWGSARNLNASDSEKHYYVTGNINRIQHSLCETVLKSCMGCNAIARRFCAWTPTKN